MPFKHANTFLFRVTQDVKSTCSSRWIFDNFAMKYFYKIVKEKYRLFLPIGRQMLISLAASGHLNFKVFCFDVHRG